MYTFKCFLFSTSGAGLKPVLSVSLFNIHIKISASLLARLLARLQESNKFENGDTFIWVAFQQRIIAHEHVQEMVFTPLCPGHLALWLPRFVCKVQRVVKVKRKLWGRKEKERRPKSTPCFGWYLLAYREFSCSKVKSLTLRKTANWWGCISFKISPLVQLLIPVRTQFKVLKVTLRPQISWRLKKITHCFLPKQHLVEVYSGYNFLRIERGIS